MSDTLRAKTVPDVIPWIKVFLDYTDAVCQALPDDGLEIRPTEPGGGFVFSALEQAMHIADERWEIMHRLTGDDNAHRLFAKGYPGKDAPWEFRQASREEVLRSLAEGREFLDSYLNEAASGSLVGSTLEQERAFDAKLTKAQAAGKDTAELIARGPENLVNTLMFLVAHETGHRTVLQHMLRMNGIEVARMA